MSDVSAEGSRAGRTSDGGGGMTARVMLPAEDVDGSDVEWLDDLLGFDVSPTAGWETSARVKALVFIVRLYAPGARNIGPTAWPTPTTLAMLLGLAQQTVLSLVTIAAAAGFLVYADDAPPLEPAPSPHRPAAARRTSMPPRPVAPNTTRKKGSR